VSAFSVRRLVASLFVTTVLVVACVGDPPIVGDYAARSCASCAGTPDCVDLRVTPTHCGACGKACAAGEVCSGGACVRECVAPYVDCGGHCVDLASDPKNCGACANTCANGICADNKCRAGACPANRGDCDGFADNGCEAKLDDSPTNCGACGASCARPNAKTACGAGKCSLLSCESGFLDCDGVASNGCEIDTANDPSHCGNCTATCPAGRACVLGACSAPPATSFASPASPTGLLVVARQVSVTFATIGNGTVKVSTVGDPTGLPGQPGPATIDLPTTTANNAVSVVRWIGGTEPEPHVLVVKIDESLRQKAGFIVESFRFLPNGSNPKSTVTNVAKGTALSIEASVQFWSSAATKVQVVYGIGATAIGCFVDENATAWTGSTPTKTGSLNAPMATGTYPVRAVMREAADCNAAKALGMAGGIDVGTVIVP
jgi:hypothetical protein